MLYALGMGWTQIGPAPSTFALAALIEIPWDQTNRRHDVVFDIIDVDGQPFMVPTPLGDRPFQLSAKFEQGRPPGVAPGTTFMTTTAVNVAPVAFQPGRQYVIRLSINGTVEDETTIRIREQPPAPAAGPA